MFNSVEQHSLTTLADTLRHLAGQLDTIASLPTGQEAAVIDILDDAEEALTRQARLLTLVKTSVQSRM